MRPTPEVLVPARVRGRLESILAGTSSRFHRSSERSPDLEKRAPPIALIVLTGLVILLIHLALYPWADISHQHPTPDSV